MFIRLLLACFILIQLPALAAAQASRPEPAGSRDHPLVGRYDGSRIRGYEQTAFDEARVITGPVQKRGDVTDQNSVMVAGRQTTIVYNGPEARSPLEVIGNFSQTLAARGFEPVFACHRESCGDRTGNFLWAALTVRRPLQSLMNPVWDSGRYAAFRLTRAEGNVWATVYVQQAAGRLETRVEVVEVRGMETDRIRVLGADELKSALDATGKVALYGIFFDVDKAEVKPDSKPQVDAIVAFLRANASVGVVVAGHTDNQGAFDYNVGLSQRRAQAVTRALVAAGVSAARLTAFGAGMSSPVATNGTSEGQGRNRRVEIVLR
jgi:outer membrane protein OmpA-like peptidoglycan-associated protein